MTARRASTRYGIHSREGVEVESRSLWGLLQVVRHEQVGYDALTRLLIPNSASEDNFGEGGMNCVFGQATDTKREERLESKSHLVRTFRPRSPTIFNKDDLLFSHVSHTRQIKILSNSPIEPFDTRRLQHGVAPGFLRVAYDVQSCNTPAQALISPSTNVPKVLVPSAIFASHHPRESPERVWCR